MIYSVLHPQTIRELLRRALQMFRTHFLILLEIMALPPLFLMLVSLFMVFSLSAVTIRQPRGSTPSVGADESMAEGQRFHALPRNLWGACAGVGGHGFCRLGVPSRPLYTPAPGLQPNPP